MKQNQMQLFAQLLFCYLVVLDHYQPSLDYKFCIALQYKRKNIAMSNGEDEKINGESGAGMPSISLQNSCFNKNWIAHLNQEEQISHLICLICKQIANNPIEINCPQHENMDESLIVGENCLKNFLSNSNACPIEPHDGCQYFKVKAMQRQINELSVICPRQFQYDVQTVGGNEEGQTAGTVMCDFKGKIKDLNDHLKQCPLKLSDCWFKPFGCKYSDLESKLQDHLISHMKHHFDLVNQHCQ
ncbi:hypothetical protein RFI_05797, partial [Reticulomyxa filosa]